MKRTAWVCMVACLSMISLSPAPGRADTDPTKFELPFGTLIRSDACPAATHVVLAPCFPHPPYAFAVFPDGKNVTRYEGNNVTMRGTLDRTSCSLPLIRASRVALTMVVPPCPPPECNPGDPPPCP